MFIGIGIGIPFSRVLGGIVQQIVNAFKTRVLADSGTFEAESCLNETVKNLTDLNLYDSASLIVTPNAYKASKIYSLKPTSGAGDLGFVRAGIKRVRNAAGNWVEIGANVPPLHYPVGGGCPSLDIEPQRTNIITRSSEFGDAAYSRFNINILSNAIAAPDGTMTADKLVATAANANHFMFQERGILGDAQMVSCFVKKGEYDTIQLARENNSFIFNFNTLSISVSGGTVTNLGFENAGNGWFRIWGRAASVANTRVTISLTNNTGVAAYLGDGVSGTFLWGLQAEGDVSDVSSPIITQGSALTRLADVPSLTGASALIGQTEGTIFFEAQLHGQSFSDNIFRFIGGVSDGTSNNRIELYRFNNQIIYIALSAGVVIGNQVIHTITDFSPSVFKTAITYQTNLIKTFYNGAASLSATPVSIMPACNRVTIGCRQSGDLQWNGLIRPAILYPTLLTDAQCIALTTL